MHRTYTLPINHYDDTDLASFYMTPGRNNPVDIICSAALNGLHLSNNLLYQNSLRPLLAAIRMRNALSLMKPAASA